MSERITKKFKIDDFHAFHLLFGNLDENIIRLEKAYQVGITSRDGEINLVGEVENVANAEEALKLLIKNIQSGEVVDRQRVNYIIDTVSGGDSHQLDDLSKSFICVTARGKAIKPKTLGQNQYIKTIQKKDLVFGIGPAGTGKTYLAVAMAIRAFKNNDVAKIIITRPAVEAGENLGFLPGDLQMKVDPYLRPLYDALFDILGPETFNSYKERGLIEIAPLAYMRGRTLDNAFIILDEAQNTTREQMKMFLTRFGFNSKVIVNGDMTQVDLPSGKKSGLIHAIDVLKNVEEIGFVTLTERDVVRHELVKKIITSYDRYERDKKDVKNGAKQEDNKENNHQK